MAQDRQPGTGAGRGRRSPGRLARWLQRRVNARMIRRVRHGGTSTRRDLLILHTVGRRSGKRRESLVSRFDDGGDGWLIVASGGWRRPPDWYFNLMGRPGQASAEQPGREAVPVTPHRLDGADREKAWQHIAAARPRFAKYQNHDYPVLRLVPR